MGEQRKKVLTRQEFLIALGLYTLGDIAQRESDRANKALAKHLGMPDWNDLGHIVDEMYSPQGRSFDELLKLEGFEVEPE